MAKVKGPLFSLSASGQIAKSIVYMTWKGIKDVRQHVIPSNPKSALQVVQRGYWKTGNTLWKATAFTAIDLEAFKLSARLQSKIMSGFNYFMKMYALALGAAKAWFMIFGLAISSITTTGFAVACTGHTGNTYSLKYGTTPTTMISTATVTNTSGALTATLSALVTKTEYYFYIYDTTSANGALTGVVKQRTA